MPKSCIIVCISSFPKEKAYYLPEVFYLFVAFSFYASLTFYFLASVFFYTLIDSGSSTFSTFFYVEEGDYFF
jgi:hypothetical protein